MPQMEPKEATGKDNMGTKKKNLTFLKPRLYMLERRKTDTVVDSSVSGDHSGPLRRSQSDRTEYNQKLQGNHYKLIDLGYCTPSCFLLFFHLQRNHLRQRRKSNITFSVRKELRKIRKQTKNKKMKVNLTHKL